MDFKKAYAPGRTIEIESGPEDQPSTPELLGRFPVKATRMAADPSPYFYIVVKADAFAVMKSALSGVFEGPGFQGNNLCALQLNVVKNEIRIIRMPN